MQPVNTVSGSQRPSLLSVIIYLTVVLLTACSTTGDKVDRLDQTLRAYESALRWAQFDTAYSFHKWDSAEQATVPAYLKSIRVTNYNVANRTFNEENMTAKQIVIIKFYNEDDARERTLEDHQTWKYFPDQNRWYLTSMPPDFK
jgi:hypothetical protein